MQLVLVSTHAPRVLARRVNQTQLSGAFPTEIP